VDLFRATECGLEYAAKRFAGQTCGFGIREGVLDLPQNLRLTDDEAVEGGSYRKQVTSASTPCEK